VAATAARLLSGQGQHVVLEEHFRWSKGQVHRAYGAPDMDFDRGKAWKYDLPSGPGGRSRTLVVAFDGQLVAGIYVDQ